MKLIRYYGKARNFNSIGCVKKRENSDRNFYFFNLCSANFTMIVFFSLGIAPQSILSQYHGKTAFFLSGSLSWNGSNTFQRKITTTKHGCFIYGNRQEQLMWQKTITSSCNKTFKQVISFLSNLTSALFNRDCLVYMFSLRFSGSKFLINLRRKFCARKISSCS